MSTVTGVHKYKWLKQNVQGLYPQSALLNTIVEFALKEEPVDVEKMRKCLLKQVKWKKMGLRVLEVCIGMTFFFFSFAVGKSRSSFGGHRYYSEISSKEFFAPVCPVCNVLWVAEAYSRRSQYRVKLFVVFAFTVLQ